MEIYQRGQREMICRQKGVLCRVKKRGKGPPRPCGGGEARDQAGRERNCAMNKDGDSRGKGKKIPRDEGKPLQP